MRFDIMTLFPDLVERVLGESIIGRAQKSGACTVRVFNIRDYSEDRRHRVDDTPFGGGKGMLLAAPPIYNCYRAVLADQLASGFDGRYDNLILLCGHYEGVDHRIIEELVDEEISLGDFVLTGGEIPACVLVDCVARLTEGVLSAAECYENESISSGMLEYPQYTRPVEYHGLRVPPVLLSGDHAKIDAWRQAESLALTRERRPDLLPPETATETETEKN